MRLRNIKGADEVIAANEFVIKNPKEYKGKWNTLFQNENPIHIEIGMGKGQFIMELAKQNPNINYIGVERYSSVLLRALQKHEETELSNLYFLCIDAATVEEIFELGEIAKIYLNFSDPWPKDRHSKRRLTSKEFLARYDKVLKKDGKLEFKTDNKALFEFSLEETKEAGWYIEKHTFDLHGDEEMNRGNIMTEYEEKFSSMGNPIHKMIIYR
ncbi:MAG: tRNA (guanosine(46)-N7)-methyltransferase TrmB [Lachnospiraceae bacterium]|nr:tRNA (guanosine(46)-N7)-methyltransferase TrmB [Lachnospiraceae bacterium]